METLLLVIGALAILAFGVAIGFKLWECGDKILSLNAKLNKAQKQITQLQQQNKVLEADLQFVREQAQKLLEENKDLKEVVGKLSRYLHNMNKAGELVAQLQQLLGVYEPEVAQHVKQILSSVQDWQSDG